MLLLRARSVAPHASTLNGEAGSRGRTREILAQPSAPALDGYSAFESMATWLTKAAAGAGARPGRRVQQEQTGHRGNERLPSCDCVRSRATTQDAVRALRVLISRYRRYKGAVLEGRSRTPTMSSGTRTWGRDSAARSGCPPRDTTASRCTGARLVGLAAQGAVGD